MSMIKVPINKNDSPLIRWGGDDAFTHSLIVGPTRCGKTATILKPLIYQILLAKKRGILCGLSIVEPKGDVARMVKEMAEDMGLKKDLVYIDPLHPNETNRINVMKGDKLDVAEATVAVLKSLFGKQDAFFATVQELSSRKVTLLLKELYGDNMDIMDVLANLRDPALLQNNVEKLRQNQGTNDLVQFFDNELLGTGNMAEKYRQFIVGLRAQLENITSNDHLKAIVTGKSDIDLDDHFEKGGILAVNTALGLLGRSGDAFGMFITMHLQLATFRRKGTERTRVPHYLIIDEYSRYINPDVERFLSIAAEYRVALIAAIQSLGQLELESGNLSGKAMKRAILTSTRNKIIFGGLEYEDADEVSKIMGKDVIRERSRTFSGGILDNILPKHYKEEVEEKERFYATFLMDGLPRFHYIHKLLINGTPQEPGIAVGDFVPRNWKEQLEAEIQESDSDRCPPIWDWRKRTEYVVKKKRLEEEEIRQEKVKSILAVNPFEMGGEPEIPVIPFPLKKDSEPFEEIKGQGDPSREANEGPKVLPKENPKPIVFSIGGKQKETNSSLDSEPSEEKEGHSEPIHKPQNDVNEEITISEPLPITIDNEKESEQVKGEIGEELQPSKEKAEILDKKNEAGSERSKEIEEKVISKKVEDESFWS